MLAYDFDALRRLNNCLTKPMSNKDLYEIGSTMLQNVNGYSPRLDAFYPADRCNVFCRFEGYFYRKNKKPVGFTHVGIRYLDTGTFHHTTNGSGKDKMNDNDALAIYQFLDKRLLISMNAIYRITDDFNDYGIKEFEIKRGIIFKFDTIERIFNIKGPSNIIDNLRLEKDLTVA